MDPRLYRLRGQSQIIDSDGSILAELAENEGILERTRSWTPAASTTSPAQLRCQAAARPFPPLARKVIIPLDICSPPLRMSMTTTFAVAT